MGLNCLNYPSLRKISRVEEQVEASLLMLAEMRIERQRGNQTMRIAEAEFRVFSQWGEDGIIQYLVHRVPIENKTFIEFGVEDYKESNTRFLLIHDNWSGLVMDGSSQNVEAIKSDSISGAMT